MNALGSASHRRSWRYERTVLNQRSAAHPSSRPITVGSNAPRDRVVNADAGFYGGEVAVKTSAPATITPVLRGWLHLLCFFASVPVGVWLILGAPSGRARIGVAVY